MRKFIVLFSILFCWQSQAYRVHGIHRVHNSFGGNLNFNTKHQYDFNGDGVKDIVQCSTNHYIRILSGKNRKPIISWAGPKKTRVTQSGEKHTLQLSGCEIAKIAGEKPMVFLSNYWNTRTWRANAPQYAVFHNGVRFVVRKIAIPRMGEYRGVTRSIRCGRYPRRLVKKGFAKGILCFFADYASDFKNRSALLKIEFNKKKRSLIARDVTGTSSLPWKNGARGTSIYDFPVGRGFRSNQRDGAFMMDSAFFDFDSNGPIDFITVGQHASIRAHRLVVDTKRRQGLRFVTTSLTSADKYNEATELLKVTAFNHIDKGLSLPCAYFSGERGGKNDRDHIRCYDRGRWITQELPMDFDSEYFNARIRTTRRGHILIKTRRQRNGGFDDLTFRIFN